ncbi:MAG: cytochrome c [Candidatus Macondimonas sp.]|jgi:cytochrome c553
MRVLKSLTMLVLTSLPAVSLAAGDPAAGQQKSDQVCAACHGPDGNSPSNQFPILAGQYEDYLVHALQSYRNGQRKNPVMTGMAQPLTDQEIQDLAAFFSSQKGLRIAR